MELLLDQMDVVKRELDNYKDKYAPSLRVLGKEKYIGNCIDLILDIVGKLVSESTFCTYVRDLDDYSKVTGATFRVFNGQYYVRVSERFVCQGVKNFLTDGGISPLIVLKLDRKINEHVTTYCLMKRLHPRTTLMCFENGVVDFEEEVRINGMYNHPKLLEFDRKYDVVKQYDFKYDPTAHRKKCNLWKNFLGITTNFKTNMFGVLPDTYKRQQLQMFLGSTLMNRKKHSFEYFMILQGDGANGKSVIFRVLRDLFGADEVSPVDLSQFTKSGDERLRAAASLEGKRLMFCPEENIKNAKTFQFIKQIASGESIAARKIGGNIKEVDCPPILMLNTNHKWTVGDFLKEEDMQDKSMLRRVQIINFEHTIPVSQRDTKLSEKLKDEKSGIFAWILVGLRNLKMNGYRMPENKQGHIEILLEKARHSVKVGNKDISGSLALYLERKGMSPNEVEGYTFYNLKSEEIYKNFATFCENEEFPKCSIQKFGRDMVSIGYDRFKHEKNIGGDNKIYYKVWIKDERVAHNFAVHVPTLLDEAQADLFEGEMYEDEEEEDGSAYVD